MNECRENLQPSDQARAGPAEEGVPINGVNSAGFDGRKVGPAVELCEHRSFTQGSLYIEAARHQDNYLRGEFHNFLPSYSCRRFAHSTKSIMAAGEINQLGHPVASGVDRIEPFDAGNARAAT